MLNLGTLFRAQLFEYFLTKALNIVLDCSMQNAWIGTMDLVILKIEMFPRLCIMQHRIISLHVKFRYASLWKNTSATWQVGQSEGENTPGTCRKQNQETSFIWSWPPSGYSIYFTNKRKEQEVHQSSLWTNLKRKTSTTQKDDQWIHSSPKLRIYIEYIIF